MDRRDVFCAGRTLLLELALLCSINRDWIIFHDQLVPSRHRYSVF